MTYIETWSDGALITLRIIVEMRLKRNPDDKQEQDELEKIKVELSQRQERQRLAAQHAAQAVTEAADQTQAVP